MIRAFSKKILTASLALMFSAGAVANNYSAHPKAIAFIDKMVVEHGFDRSELELLMADAERKQAILDAIARPAEKTKAWKDYRKIFLGTKRIEQGKAFLKEHEKTLARAEQEFGVPASVIAAIIGVETRYGRHKGSYRVVDALATLAFDYPPRSTFFTSELENYLLLVNEQQFNPRDIKGSYAGAMGYGQFIPSSYRHYAIDYDGDGIADIIDNPVDAIGSVANYFKRHGWRAGESVACPVKLTADADLSAASSQLSLNSSVAELKQKGFTTACPLDGQAKAIGMLFEGEQGQEVWLGLQNFYVITRYNRSQMYALAVLQLSEELAQP